MADTDDSLGAKRPRTHSEDGGFSGAPERLGTFGAGHHESYNSDCDEDDEFEDDDWELLEWAEKDAMLQVRIKDAKTIEEVCEMVHDYLKIDAEMQQRIIDYPQKSQLWLKARIKRITGSVAAAVTGRHSYESVEGALVSMLWKVFKENDAMRYGTRHEPVACLCYYLLQRDCFANAMFVEKGDTFNPRRVDGAFEGTWASEWENDGDERAIVVLGNEYAALYRVVMAWDGGDLEGITHRVEHITTTGEIPDDVLAVVPRAPAPLEDIPIVLHTGLVVSVEYPQFGTSSDGDLYKNKAAADRKESPNLLEIKCPYGMDGTRKNVYRRIPPYYLTQIQMSNHLRSMQYTHFFVWTPTQMVLRTYRYDPEYSKKLFDEMQHYYWNRLIPCLWAKARGLLREGEFLTEEGDAAQWDEKNKIIINRRRCT